MTVFHFPSYAPDLNPQEGIWSLVKRTIGNLAAADLDQLAAAVKRSLKKTQSTAPHRRLPHGHRPDHRRLTTIKPTSHIQVQ
ncbi:hypothetical protein AB0N74_30120 [Streptomyces anulatus]